MNIKKISPNINILFLYLSFFLTTFATPFHRSDNINAERHNQKYVIGQCSMQGLFSCFFVVLNQLAQCEKNNNTPTVFWDQSCTYYHPNGFNDNHNVWEYYFEPVSDLVYESPENIDNSYIFNDFNFNATSDAIRQEAHSLISKYIKIKPCIHQKIADFYDRYIAGKKTIAIHLRATDRQKQQTITTPQQLVEQALQHADENTQFFIASDDQLLFDTMLELFQGFTVIYHNCYRSKDGKPLHYCAGNQPDDLRPSFAQMGEDVLIEAMLMSRCDFLVHNQSSVSTASLYFNPTMEHICLTQPDSSKKKQKKLLTINHSDE